MCRSSNWQTIPTSFENWGLGWGGRARQPTWALRIGLLSNCTKAKRDALDQQTLKPSRANYAAVKFTRVLLSLGAEDVSLQFKKKLIPALFKTSWPSGLEQNLEQ